MEMPGSIRSRITPSLIHHTGKALNPPKPTLAKEGPLSVLIASGGPYSRKTLSIVPRTPWPWVPLNPWQASR